MTLGSFILTLRKRLQDNYDVNGSKIVAAGTDGIRWSSAELLDIINESMIKSANLIYTYLGNAPLVDSSFHRIHTLNFASYRSVLPSDALNILDAYSVEHGPYSRKSLINFLKFKHSARVPREEGRYFTQYQDSTTGVRYMELSPTPTGSGDIIIIYLRSKSDYVIGDIAVQLQLNGFNFFVLDVAEKEARDREHNWERSKTLGDNIVVNLGGVQNANDSNRNTG